jgi:hypothetical protein
MTLSDRELLLKFRGRNGGFETSGQSTYHESRSTHGGGL